jgi:hypothetical protein
MVIRMSTTHQLSETRRACIETLRYAVEVDADTARNLRATLIAYMDTDEWEPVDTEVHERADGTWQLLTVDHTTSARTAHIVITADSHELQAYDTWHGYSERTQDPKAITERLDAF